ncbi:O-antigen ligase [Demequina sp. NBRC 110055]|uniref:O-antigen ligase family protein n=1 Tax=Demequina sp. NBRC 110055 TaxID=1570344 RepID=UPI0013566E2C|nr:O-antigen ligase family protein [Demequina sp. NBRC 110055]
METATARERALRWLASTHGREAVAVWSVVFLVSGQGFRYLLGMALYSVLAVVTVTAVAIAFRTSAARVKLSVVVLAFVALTGLSVIWSVTPAVTALAALVTVATTYVAIVTVQNFGTSRFLELLYRGLQWSLLLGVSFELIVAAFIRDEVRPLVSDLTGLAGLTEKTSPFMWSENHLLEGGPIQGFVGNRNPFAAIALLTAILALMLYLERRVSRRNAFITLAVSAAVLLLTQSATVAVMALVVAVLFGVAVVVRHADTHARTTVSLYLLGTAAVVGWMSYRYKDAVLAMLDRDSDLTNRTEIWERVISVASDRVEGWGFVGYWPVWSDPYASIVDQTTERATHAHNAFLDSWLQLGVVGLILLVVLVGSVFFRSWRVVQRGERHSSWIPVAWALLIAALGVQALSESRLLVEGGWYMLVALTAMVPGMVAVTPRAPHLARTGAGQPVPRRTVGPVRPLPGQGRRWRAARKGGTDEGRVD